MQGVAEVLPVSSSAHLALVPWWRRWPEEPGRTTLAAGLHAGSCAGIAWVLRDDLRELVADPARVSALALESLPAAAAGLLAADLVEARLGRPEQVAALMAGAGALMALADARPQRGPLRPAARTAAALAQVAALLPGVSRGGVVLTSLRMAQVPRDQAWRHALHTSLPITAGAAGLTLLRADKELLRALVPALLVGVPVAAVTSACLVSRVSAVRLDRIALYRLGLAAAIAVEHRRRRHL